jgi:uncharacterized membrane protein
MKLFCTKTLMKSITWRVIATTITAIISYFVTENIEVAGKIIAADFALKTISYYGHEKLWESKNG